MSLSRVFVLVRRIPREVARHAREMARQVRRDARDALYDARRMKKSTLNKIYGTITVVVTVGGSTLYLLANTYHRHYIEDIVALKVGDIRQQLDTDLELMALREWNFAHVPRPPKLRGLMSYFMVKGSTPFSIGDLGVQSGAIIGLPHNFTYKTVDDVNLNELKILGEDSDRFESESDLMKQLTEALVLSDKAKRFAITREIHLTNIDRCITEALNIAVASGVGLGGAHHVIIHYNIRQLYLLSSAIRLCFVAIGVGLWFVVRQAFHYSWNLSADKAAVNQGPDYYEGAVEYYQKRMQKNAALYALLGKEGHKKFTEDGEEKGLLSTVPSFKKRLDKIRELHYSEKELADIAEEEGGDGSGQEQ